MSVFSKRNLLVGIVVLVVGVGAGAAIWGVPGFKKRSTSVTSQVTAYLLDDRGAVNGLLLSSGDQLHFSAETGTIVGSQIKVGDEVTASGHAGSQSSYGREFRVKQISANGRTIVVAGSGRHKQDDKHGGPKDRAHRSGPPDAPAQSGGQPATVGTTPQSTEPNRASANDSNVKETGNAVLTTAPSPAPLPAQSPAQSPAMSPETFKATGTIRTHLVNGHGDVVGLILSTGEQMRFSPKVGGLVVAAEQSGISQVSVEGSGVRNERGTVISPTQITVGNQTIALGR